MVLHKRLDYGSSGYHVPPMPRVPRSAKGKRSARKKIEEKQQISAFDLLATVAGELLSEREESPTSKLVDANDSIKQQEQKENWRASKAEVFDQGSCNESTLGSKVISKRQLQSPKPIEKDGERSELEGLNETEIRTPLKIERRMSGSLIDVNIPQEILEDPMDLDGKPPLLVSSDSSVEVPVSHNGKRLVVDRDDDDENSSGCTHPNSNVSKVFNPQRVGDRRIRKLLASRFWKVPPTSLKEDGELSNTDGEMKSVCRNKKMCYTRQRTQRSAFKRRKLFERHSFDGGIYGDAVSSSPKLGGIKIEASDAYVRTDGANGASSSTSGQKSNESGDYHVKLRIKSFKVPELFIEIPETATVGSLKRTVMEAVTAILAGGLRVGVLLQGKKVRDDKQTLLQAGISRNDRSDNLGFTLEPNSTQTIPLLTCSEEPTSLLLPSNPCLPCAPVEPIQRILAIAPAIDQLPMVAAPEPTPQAFNCPESDYDSVYSPDSIADKASDSKAVVPVRAMNAGALAVVPLRKSRRSELVQRRIRRPFSVAEVEALVQAVEKLGTGRWRDVKIRAFDHAKHRTYVDLKDKWKTLVHTARISPQQRRGEPVPQELLDRVLSAHAYWSQQQAKLQVKPASTSHSDSTTALVI